MNVRKAVAAGLAVVLLTGLAACIYIANLRPVASFTVDPASGISPLDVLFDASASNDADGTIETYLWSFGDGQTASRTVPTISHTYTVQSFSRVFTSTLTVVDDLGGEDTAVKDITVDPI